MSQKMSVTMRNRRRYRLEKEMLIKNMSSCEKSRKLSSVAARLQKTAQRHGSLSLLIVNFGSFAVLGACS